MPKTSREAPYLLQLCSVVNFIVDRLDGDEYLPFLRLPKLPEYEFPATSVASRVEIYVNELELRRGDRGAGDDTEANSATEL